MTIKKADIEQYLHEVKDAVRNNRYQIDRNQNRQDNINLFVDYILDEAGAKRILLSLDVDDFSGIKQNDHVGYRHEKLYVFGKKVKMIERYGSTEKEVPLYIKINKLKSKYVIVISFHEQKYPLVYYFR